MAIDTNQPNFYINELRKLYKSVITPPMALQDLIFSKRIFLDALYLHQDCLEIFQQNTVNNLPCILSRTRMIKVVELLLNINTYKNEMHEIEKEFSNNPALNVNYLTLGLLRRTDGIIFRILQNHDKCLHDMEDIMTIYGWNNRIMTRPKD